MWDVFLTREAEKTLDKLPATMRERTDDALRKMKSDPYLGKPLKGQLLGKYSYRLGDYRIVYSPLRSQQHLLIHYVRHRREAYR